MTAANQIVTGVFRNVLVFGVDCVSFCLSYLQVEHTGEKLQKTA